MKKIYLLTILMAFVSFSFAQKTYTSLKKMNKIELSAKTGDTLYPASCLTGSPALYNAQGGGYVCGNNGYGDLAKAQAFLVTAPYNVTGMIVWVGGKEQIGTAGTVKFQLYNMDGTGTGTAGTVSAPSTVLGTVSVPTDMIDTGLSLADGGNIIMFPAPVYVSGDYAIGVDFSSIGNDTLGIVSTTDADAGGSELSWEKWSDNAWHSLLSAWPLDFDLFIFAIIDDGAGINDNYFINGIKLSQNQPNPANGITLVQYEIESTSKVSLDIFDVTGRLVFTTEEGMQNAGLHNINIDADKLDKGTYYYSLKAGSNRLTKKMIVQ